MRLPERLGVPIKAALSDIFGEAPVYLFGSRADDSKKGGDIDLAVETDIAKEEFLAKKIQFLARMARNDWDVSIDLVQLASRSGELLKNEVRSTGVPLV